MWKGIVAAYLVTAACYFPVALLGCWAFGRDVGDNVLVALQRPPWLVAAANMMVVIHVVGSYQLSVRSVCLCWCVHTCHSTTEDETQKWPLNLHLQRLTGVCDATEETRCT